MYLAKAEIRKDRFTIIVNIDVCLKTSISWFYSLTTRLNRPTHCSHIPMRETHGFCVRSLGMEESQRPCNALDLFTISLRSSLQVKQINHRRTQCERSTSWCLIYFRAFPFLIHGLIRHLKKEICKMSAPVSRMTIFIFQNSQIWSVIER